MNDRTSFKLALVSMPWSLLNRPSIQLGTLKSYLNAHSDFTVINFHPYLDIAKAIGTDTYNELALSGWAGEALFAPLLFPEKYREAKKLFYLSLKSKNNSRKPRIDFDSMSKTIESTCREWVDNLDVSTFNLVGLTVCFNQLLPSLYLARLLKSKSSNCRTVFGGSSCSDDLGKSMVQTFKDVDFAISGEGEGSLLELCAHLSGESSLLPADIFSQDVAQINKSKMNSDHKRGELDLDDLPPPDYNDYFKEVARIFPGSPFIPVLPVEFSRGCWWNKCSFCNLNIQWQNYKSKNGERMLHETLKLAQIHETVQFVFTDNALPPKEADIFFAQIAEQPIDLNFFAEIRAITQPERLKNYRRGGLTTVQIGIESLSTSLLEKMAKGSTAIENISVMKMCIELSIEVEGNIIVEFPSTSEKEIKETLANLEFVMPYKPLDTATFFLGYGSPVYNCCKDFSIQTILPHPKNKNLFPKEIMESMDMLLHSYRGDRTKQQQLWEPVRRKVKEWKAFHAARKAKEPALSYRDGGSFLIIRQELANGSVLQHRLKGLSRKIYLACNKVVSFDSLHTSFPQVNENALKKFIDDMCMKKLMFTENKQILSLAVHNPQVTLLP